jgi:hypothetical protein
MHRYAMQNGGVVLVLSSFIAGEIDNSEGEGIVIRNPGRVLSAPASERERLRSRGRPIINLPQLAASLSLYSTEQRGEAYRLSFAFISPGGDVIGQLQSRDFVWGRTPLERISLRLDGQISFFEEGGIYRLRFLFNGEPLCEIPVPIDWDDQAY